MGTHYAIGVVHEMFTDSLVVLKKDLRLPSTTVLPAETDEQALKREMRATLGIGIRVGSLLV